MVGIHELKLNWLEPIADQGFAIGPSGLSSTELDNLQTLFAEAGHGQRNLLALPAIRALAASPNLRNPVTQILGPQAQPVRGLFFDKTADANWKVTWHQDLTIAIADRPPAFSDQAYGPWSIKAGIAHVQPPIAILEQLLTVRLHLDAADATNGALHVLPGSHRSGRLSGEAIQAWRSQEAVCCVADRGDLLVMRPLLLHSSSAASQPSHRRVIHIEYAAIDLPPPLAWQIGPRARPNPPPAALEPPRSSALSVG
jgi:ectoine hydroxylase-related dioxygenase (phytanoyl-CoA dioxygenase family)